MSSHIEELRGMCSKNFRGASPFRVRVQFERHLFGLVTDFSTRSLGARPRGISREHCAMFVQKYSDNVRTTDASVDRALHVLSDAATLHEKFSSLCDSSNWSDDGQDPRIEWCREDILVLCNKIEKWEREEVVSEARE